VAKIKKEDKKVTKRGYKGERTERRNPLHEGKKKKKNRQTGSQKNSECQGGRRTSFETKQGPPG